MFRGRRRRMAGPGASTGVARSAGRKGPIIAVAVVGVLALGGWLLIGGFGRGAGTGPGPSGSAADVSNDASGSDGPAAPSAVPTPGHEVYGFVPYWEMDETIAGHLATTRATTVALFSVTNTAKGPLALTQNGARRIMGPIGRAIIADVHGQGRRVDLAFTSFGRAKNGLLLGSQDVQARVIDGLVALRAELGVDGIAVDIEEIDDVDIPAYGAFVGRLRTALQADHPDATVTVTTGAGPQGAAMALSATVAGADRIFLMGYNYRTGTSAPGATAPIVRHDGDERTLGWSLDLYATAGVPPQRTLLGLPLYGISWPTDSPELGALSTGNGSVWVPRQNLATLNDRTLTPVTDPLESVSFVAVPDGKAWRAIYWDTPETLAPKLALAEEHGLAGAGFWALGYDRGVPGYIDLIARFRDGQIAISTGTAPSP